MRIVYLAVGWSAGILLAANFEAEHYPIWLLLLFTALLLLFLMRRHPLYRIAALALIFLALGALRYAAVPTTSALARYNNLGAVTIFGLVVAEPDIRDTRTQLQVQADSLTFDGRTERTSGLVLVSTTRNPDIRYGDRVVVRGELSTPAEFDTFSYADYLARSGIFSIVNFARVQVRDSGYGNPIFTALLDAKREAQHAIAHYLPEPQAGLLTGILLGNERGISPELDDDFRVVGASHVIAISGFNMVILSSVIMKILERLRIPRFYAAALGITAIAVYTIFVGANAAVVRAAAMSSLLVVAPLFKRKTYVPASLAFITIVMSLQNPLVLWDLSFQLSFFAVLGLALFADPLSRRFDALLTRLFPLKFAQNLSNLLTEPIVVTSAVQITVLPLIALYFSRVSLLTLPVNLLIVPVQSYLLLLGVTAMGTAFIIPALSQLLFWFCMLLLSWTITIVRLFAQIPFAEIEFVVDPRLITLYFFVIIGGAALQAAQPRWLAQVTKSLRRRSVVLVAALTSGALLLLTLALLFSRPDGKLHVWMLDVGHTNAVLIQTPGGAQMLVDGGTFPSRLLTALGDRLPFNDREIEVLFITKPDQNTYSALTAVLTRYNVGIVLLNGQTRPTEAFAALQTQIAVHETVAVRAGYTLKTDDSVEIEVLHPQSTPSEDAVLNDHAMVLRVRYRSFSLLLTSDVSVVGQEALLASGYYPSATVFQLPNHGSAESLSAALLSAVQPQIALLQADVANRDGDPSAATLAQLGAIPLYRTDRGGAIHLWTDGTAVWVLQNR